jgi:hypothetical protein
MRKRLLLAGAAGLTVLGLTTAGASTLNLASPGSWFAGIVQQSDNTTTSCVPGALEVSLPIEGTSVDHAVLLQQYIQGCAGQEAQVVLFNGGSMVAASETKRIEANGLDVSLDFASPVGTQSFDQYRVTIGSDIVAP